MILQIAIFALAAVGCLIVGKWVGKRWFGVKKGVSGLKRAAQELAIKMREKGLKRTPKMFEDFVVGDVDDLFQSLKEFAALVKDGDAIEHELDAAFERSLAKRLVSPEGRAELRIKLDAAQGIAIEIAKAAAPVVAAAAISVAVPAAAPVVVPAAVVAAAL